MQSLKSILILFVTWTYGKRISHAEQHYDAEGMSNFKINGTLTKLNNIYYNHPVNWTSPHPLLFSSGNSLSGLGLPKESQLFYRYIVNRVVSDIEKPKKISMPPQKVYLFALTNTDNNNWTSFDYNKVQIDWILKSKLPNVKACPIQIPFYDGKNCISCPEGTYFDVESKQCGGPSLGMVFDPNLHTFVRPYTHFKTRISAGSLDGTGISKNYWNEEIKKIQESEFVECSWEKPYFDGITCVPCQMPNPIFNLKTLLCTHCYPPKYYSSYLHGCYVLNGKSYNLNVMRSIGRIFTSQN